MRRRSPAACQRIAASRSRARLGRCEANGNTAPPAAPTAKVNVEVFYVHPDHLGTPRVITASTALAATTGTGITSAQTVNKAVWRWDSDPFGSNATANSAPNENPNTLSQVVGTSTLPYLFGFDLAFPGQKRDRETGKHYNYFRDYDPAVGRYFESDPIGLRGGINTFGYVAQMPTKFIDPKGLASVDKKCCDQDKDLPAQIDSACARVAAQITNPKLRECILNRCKTARVTCDGLVCWAGNPVGWHNPIFGGTITLCIKGNEFIGSSGGAWGCVAIHEWAHSCGWGHGDGMGVPGNSGMADFGECSRTFPYDRVKPSPPKLSK